MAIARYRLVAFDCPDARALADFYQSVVGGEITQADEDWVELRTEGGGIIAFQQVSEYTPPGWPDGSPQQAHLDFAVADLDEGETLVLAVGARKADVQPSPNEWRVFLDPAGHPFCLVTD